MDNQYVFAMYDVRGKQDYIFRGTKIKEIVGGSLVIRDIFCDELYEAAEKVAGKIYNYKNMNSSEDTSFSRESFEKHIEDGYVGEVVYEGGGNFFILYKDEKTYTSINKDFTKRVLEHTYSLTVLCSKIVGVDFDDYKGDRDKLYAVNRERESRINAQLPAQVLPFTQVDYANSLPLYKEDYIVGKRVKLTRESYRKYKKYEKIAKENKNQYGEKVLDNIVKEKGEDSWIAVMYIDGNNMGAKVQAILGDKFEKVSYEEAASKLREFSEEIQKNYIDDRIAAIDERLKEKYVGSDDYKRRLVVYAGDEINIILNAHDAFDAVKAYFEGMPEGNSACAGVAIFKSHMPYSDAYRIAEECCESGKQLMKKYAMKETNLIDFHLCQGATGTDLESIRKRETGSIISKPWFVEYKSDQVGDIPLEDVVSLEMVEKTVDNLNSCSRTNVKGLLDCAKNSESELFAELSRMQVRRKESNGNDISKVVGVDDNNLAKDKVRNLIYDIVSVYDLWFR